MKDHPDNKEVLLERILADRNNLERILDSLSEGIIAHDMERRILFFNRSAERTTGYTREEVVGRDCHEAFGSPFCKEKCSFFEAAPRAWKNLEYPLHITAKSGEPRRIEMRVTGMGDAAGCLVGVIAAFRDVTDLIDLKMQLGQVTGFGGIIGQDHEMVRVYRQVLDVASYDYPIHLFGETGTGKELVAAAIHNESGRAGGPFVPVNCGALPEGVLESELFGHVRGAFSGAVRDKRGRFELAHGGTLFLDEVADMPKPLQVRLLRVLQEGSFERVGGEETVSVDVRIISATNRDLRREVKRGHFREDLFYRINVFPIRLPPLRERKNDIPLLAAYFLEKTRGEGNRAVHLSKSGLALMMDYPWPGNVRELQSAIRFASVKCKGRLVHPEDLPIELLQYKSGRAHRGPSRKLDPESVRAALSQSGGNKKRASQLLGVGRATLYRFLSDSPDVS